MSQPLPRVARDRAAARAPRSDPAGQEHLARRLSRHGAKRPPNASAGNRGQLVGGFSVADSSVAGGNVDLDRRGEQSGSLERRAASPRARRMLDHRTCCVTPRQFEERQARHRLVAGLAGLRVVVGGGSGIRPAADAARPVGSRPTREQGGAAPRAARTPTRPSTLLATSHLPPAGVATGAPGTGPGTAPGLAATRTTRRARPSIRPPSRGRTTASTRGSRRNRRRLRRWAPHRRSTPTASPRPSGPDPPTRRPSPAVPGHDPASRMPPDRRRRPGPRPRRPRRANVRASSAASASSAPNSSGTSRYPVAAHSRSSPTASRQRLSHTRACAICPRTIERNATQNGAAASAC